MIETAHENLKEKIRCHLLFIEQAAAGPNDVRGL
jgi:hypothetical protein